jgi:hypothetical protein
MSEKDSNLDKAKDDVVSSELLKLNEDVLTPEETDDVEGGACDQCALACITNVI